MHLWNRQLSGNVSKPVLRTDNGPQFIAGVFEAACEHYGVEHERIPCRTPNKHRGVSSNT